MGDGVDDGHRLSQRALVCVGASVCAAIVRAGSLVCVKAIRHERPQTSAEDVAQFPLERVNRVRDVTHGIHST